MSELISYRSFPRSERPYALNGRTCRAVSTNQTSTASTIRGEPLTTTGGESKIHDGWATPGVWGSFPRSLVSEFRDRSSERSGGRSLDVAGPFCRRGFYTVLSMEMLLQPESRGGGEVGRPDVFGVSESEGRFRIAGHSHRGRPAHPRGPASRRLSVSITLRRDRLQYWAARRFYYTEPYSAGVEGVGVTSHLGRRGVLRSELLYRPVPAGRVVANAVPGGTIW